MEKLYDLYVQNNSLLLADVFENFWNMCLEIYELDPHHVLSSPGLAGQAALKKIPKIWSFNWYWYLFMVEKGIGGRIVTLFIDMQKLIINAWNIMIKIKNCYIFNIGNK